MPYIAFVLVSWYDARMSDSKIWFDRQFPTPCAVLLAERAGLVQAFEAEYYFRVGIGSFQKVSINGSFESALRVLQCMLREDEVLNDEQIQILKTIYDVTKDEVMGVVSEQLIATMGASVSNPKAARSGVDAAQALCQILKDGRVKSSDLGRLLQKAFKK